MPFKWQPIGIVNGHPFIVSMCNPQSRNRRHDKESSLSST